MLRITADVHCCAAHHYSPEGATSTDVDPSWEVVAGVIDAGTFGPSRLEPSGRGRSWPGPPTTPQSPRGGNQFFGHVDVARWGLLTVPLRNARGDVLWSRGLEPGERRS